MRAHTRGMQDTEQPEPTGLGGPASEDVLTVREVAQRLKKSEWQVYRLIRGGHLRATKGGQLRIPVAAFRDYLNPPANSAPPAEATAEGAEQEDR